MPAKIFSMEARQDGGARLALNYKHAGRSGIQRISCDLAQDGLLQLVLFAEALSLRKRFGQLAPSGLTVDGLTLAFDPAQPDLHVLRQAGYSSQTARLPLTAFHAAMAGMTELCIARAEASRHGTALKLLLADCPPPPPLAAQLGQDEGDLAMHHLREIALLLLAQDAAARGSALARMLRGRKTQDQARAAVSSLVQALAAELAPLPA